ncbi:DUF2279 domain-containing protein [Telluribacter sp. SYSU D00476]|uniref:DUF2279 domain-containing protein n=1 Tax=Telluribacter sp. SYSU D00476 TaxID=2811430 RepID=UPI001FF44FAC|nr:DUF2279 domain-containing protein [Telluribacter sp. SYSU D00476]
MNIGGTLTAIFPGKNRGRLGWLLVLFAALLLSATSAFAFESDSLTRIQKRNRQIGVITGFAAGYTTSLILLHNAWYEQDEPRSTFYFHDDLHHWKQVDKAGHFWTAFHQSRAGVDVLKWSGVPDKKALLYGSLVGVVLQTPIEIFDGYSETYGASLSDMGANTLGSAAVWAQYHLWNEVRIMPKFSFHKTNIETGRVMEVGDHYFEQMLKDYNGQTYWLAADLSAFLPKGNRFPKWLNIAVGYGASEMAAATTAENRRLGYDAYRRYYLTLDLNLMNIKTRSKVLKTVFNVISAFHLPAPALEYNRKQGFVFRPLYF